MMGGPINKKSSEARKNIQRVDSKHLRPSRKETTYMRLLLMNRSWISHSKNIVLSALSFPTARRAVLEAAFAAAALILVVVILCFP